MKKLLLFSAICTSLFIISCNKDDEPGPSFEFKNQDLQGMINGTAWEIASGYAEDSPWEDTDLSIELTNVFYDDPCSEFILDGIQVFFDIPKEVGVYELKLATDGQTITLYDPDGSLNTIVVEGAVEITSISDSEVSGRIDGRSDDDNHVNGNFTVPFCPS